MINKFSIKYTGTCVGVYRYFLFTKGETFRVVII